MPATTADIEKLKSLLRYLRAPDTRLPTTERLTMSLGAMEQSIAMLESGAGGTIKDFLLTAILQAHIETRPGRWTLHDPDMRNWALGEIAKLPYVKQ